MLTETATGQPHDSAAIRSTGSATFMASTTGSPSAVGSRFRHLATVFGLMPRRRASALRLS